MNVTQRLTTTLGKEEWGFPDNSGYCILVDRYVWEKIERGTFDNIVEQTHKLLCKKRLILSIAVACPRFHPCATSLARNHGSQKICRCNNIRSAEVKSVDARSEDVRSADVTSEYVRSADA